MVFTIAKDQHYCDRGLYRFFKFLNRKNKLEYNVTFDESCQYTLPEKDQADINKLFGFSLGLDHHTHSARFGWAWHQDRLKLFAYLYIEGIRKSFFITNLKINVEYKLSIEIIDFNYILKVREVGGNPLFRTSIRTTRPFAIGYKLWPYFGGNNPAPHDIRIKLT